jgi:hypothetical protein
VREDPHSFGGGATNNDIKEMIKIMETYPISVPKPAADSVSEADRKKTDGSTIQRDSTESHQVKQEPGRASLQVERGVIHFDEFRLEEQPRFFRSLVEPKSDGADKTTASTVERDQTRAASLETEKTKQKR